VTLSDAPGTQASATAAREVDDAWHARDPGEVALGWGTHREEGLDLETVAQRRDEYGANALRVERENSWHRILVRQFKDVLIAILAVAAVAALVIGEVGDAVTILAIVVLNAALGFAQEWKAEQALSALAQMLTPRCSVVRGGDETEIDAAELVPGDLVLLETGDRVPADLRLLEAVNLRADESALTGESVPVLKDPGVVSRETPLDRRTSMAWTGTEVVNGWARGVAVATGVQTEFGRIAELSRQVEETATPLQRRLAKLGAKLGILSVFVAASIGVLGSLAGKPITEMFMTGVSLAVAVVPEGLPAVVTITLALGIRAMVRRRALLRRLSSAEALGAATVICTDKTGTLTQNEMTVRRIWLPAGELEVTGVGYDLSGEFEAAGQRIDRGTRPDLLALLETGLACSHARVAKEGETWKALGEPTEAALVVAAHKASLDRHAIGAPLTEFSFNSSRKRMTIVRQDAGERIAHVKGAPEVLADLCSQVRDGERQRPLSAEDRAAFLEICEDFAARGLRTLALARRVLPKGVELTDDAAVESDLTLLGAVGILDPPRQDVPDAILLARRAGIRVLMITGDAGATALAIAERIGLPSSGAVLGTELSSMSDEQLSSALSRDVVFARTTPEHKLRIVALLQEQGHIVGMTGDGVNDAPALKQADIGIAMGLRGTDVAKGASDIVLTDDNFTSIVGAIEEGRRQYDNIRKFVRYLLSSNTGEVLAILANVLIGGPLILLPVQILWMNLVTDGVTAVALGLERAEPNVMHRPPRPVDDPILDRGGAAAVLLLGSYIAGVTLWLYHDYLGSPHPEGAYMAQTVAFTGIIVLEKVNVFNFRSLMDPLWRVGVFSNPWVIGAWLGMLGLQICAVYVPLLQRALHTVPLGWEEWARIGALALPVIAIPELWKWWHTRVPEELSPLEQ
jgi:Ca2+-transporting ATPase